MSSPLELLHAIGMDEIHVYDGQVINYEHAYINSLVARHGERRVAPFLGPDNTEYTLSYLLMNDTLHSMANIPAISISPLNNTAASNTLLSVNVIMRAGTIYSAYHEPAIVYENGTLEWYENGQPDYALVNIKGREYELVGNILKSQQEEEDGAQIEFSNIFDKKIDVIIGDSIAIKYYYSECLNQYIINKIYKLYNCAAYIKKYIDNYKVADQTNRYIKYVSAKGRVIWRAL